MKTLIVLIMLLCCAAPISAQNPQSRLLDHLIVTEQSHPALGLREISGLIWDAQDETLLALSDRNDLYRLALGPDRDRIAFRLIERARLSDAVGERLRRRHFSAEAIALAEAHAGKLAIVSETPPRLGIFDRRGRLLRDLSLPPELRDVSRLRSPGSGLESLALHPTRGFLFAPERPLAGQPRQTHVVYDQDGPAFAFQTGDAERTKIKAMESLPGGRLLILERERMADLSIRITLRVLDPADCPVTAPCIASAIPLDLPPPHDADFEGLAWLGENRVLIASDDRVGGEFRTVFALIELPIDD